MALLALPAYVSTWTVKKTLLIRLITAYVKAWNKFYLTFNHFESSCTLCSAEKVWTSNNNAAVIAAKLFHSCMMHMQCESQFWCLLAAKFPANGKGFHQRMVQWFIYLEWNIWNCTEKVGSMLVSEHLRTYPFPNPTLTLICRQLAVVWFGGGRGKGAVAKIVTLIENAFSLDLRSFWDRP